MAKTVAESNPPLSKTTAFRINPKYPDRTRRPPPRVKRDMALSTVLALAALAQPRSVYPVPYVREGRVFVVEQPGQPPREIGPGKLPAIDPLGLKLAYVRQDPRDAETLVVVTLRDFKSSVTPEGVPAGSILQPTWSPDGLQVTFEHRFPEEGRTVYTWKVREPRALGVFNLTDEEEDMNPTFLEQDRLAFLWKGKIATMDLATGSFQQTEPTPYLDGLPASARISAVVGLRGNPGQFVYAVTGPLQAVFLYNAADQAVLRLSPVGIAASQPKTTPDPRRITFVGTDKEGETWVYTVSLDGKNLAKVLQLPPVLP